jgi:hypothetical protein
MSLRKRYDGVKLAFNVLDSLATAGSSTSIIVPAT